MENITYFDNIEIANAAEDGSVMRIEGYACHWDEANLNRQRVNANSFQKFFDMMEAGKLDNPILNYNHDSAMLIGRVDGLERNDRGLWMKAHINKDVAFVRDTLMPMILNKDINKLSTEGYISKNDVEFFDDDTFYIKNFMLSAIAVVSTPADWDATFSLTNVVNRLKPTDEEAREEIRKSRLHYIL